MTYSPKKAYVRIVQYLRILGQGLDTDIHRVNTINALKLVQCKLVSRNEDKK